MGESGARRASPGIRRGGEQYERIHSSLARAALIEFAEHGYSDFSVEMTAERADVGVRTAYRHYESKLDLALAAISVMPDYTGWLDGEDSSADRLLRGLAIASAHRQYFAPVLATCLVHRKSEPALLRLMRSRVLIPRTEAIRSFVTSGIAAGELRADLDPAGFSALETGVQMSIAAGTLNVGRGQQRVEALFSLMWPMISA
jgi:AcrR family transcriptional regulator